MKSRLMIIATCMIAILLLCPIAAVPAFAAGGFTNNTEEVERYFNDPDYQAQRDAEWHNQRVQEASEKAAEIEKRIDALPSYAGIAEKEEIESIRREIETDSGGTTNPLYPDERIRYHISAEHLQKLEAAEERVKNPTMIDRARLVLKDQDATKTAMIILAIWEAIWAVQAFLAYGTAYRKTKAKGDNGVSLFGWMLLYDLAALVPGLGFYLWHRSKKPNS